MRFRYNTSTTQFIEWLRESGIKGGMPPQFIDCVDKLDELDGRDAEIEKLGEELTEKEKACDNLLDELRSIVKAIDENLDPDTSPAIENALKIAIAAITRHET